MLKNFDCRTFSNIFSSIGFESRLNISFCMSWDNHFLLSEDSHHFNSGTSSLLKVRNLMKLEFSSLPSPRRGRPCWPNKRIVENILSSATRLSDICSWCPVETFTTIDVFFELIMAFAATMCSDETSCLLILSRPLLHFENPSSTHAALDCCSHPCKLVINFLSIASVQILQIAFSSEFNNSHGWALHQTSHLPLIISKSNGKL